MTYDPPPTANFSRKGVSTDQLERYKLLQNRCTQLDSELNAYTDLLAELANMYKEHKGLEHALLVIINSSNSNNDSI